MKPPPSYFYSYWLVLFQLLHSKCFTISFTDWKNFSTSTVTNPTITNQTGCLFRDHTSYFSTKLRLNLLFAEKVTQFSFIWCGLILCLSTDLRWVGVSNISMLDCLWTRNESVLKRRQKSFLVEGCQVTIQSLRCWYLLCVSSKTCTIVRNSVSNNII